MNGLLDTADQAAVTSNLGRSFAPNQLSDRGNIVGWCGYLYEESTGMWLARHRWQIPELGRWTNRDPIGYAGGGQNLYEYVNGNPVFLQDPMGLSDENPHGTWDGQPDNIAHLRGYTDENGKRQRSGSCWAALRSILEDQREGESMDDCAERVEASKRNFQNWDCQKELAKDSPEIPWDELLTDPHVVLGALGMIPGVGIAADLVDAGLYLAEGDFLNAGISLVAAIPFVGDGVGAARLASRASKTVNVATGPTGAPAARLAAAASNTTNTTQVVASAAGTTKSIATTKRVVQPRNSRGRFIPWNGSRYRASGADAVDDFVRAAKNDGFIDVGREVVVHTPFGDRRYDVLLRSQVTGKLTAVEVKSSWGAFTRFDRAARHQFAADRWLNRSGGANASGRFEDAFISGAGRILWLVD